MAKTKKWAEQALVEQAFGYKDENGNEVVNKMMVLDVCLTGQELYRKEFIEGKYGGRNRLGLPFHFIVLYGGSMAPQGGRFYEVEYTIGEHGMMYRALIQAVRPEEDLQLVLGVLKKKNVLPADLKAHRAWLRSDIEAVRIGNCTKDEDGEAVFYSGHVEAKDCHVGLKEYALEFGNLGCCIEYYRGDVREVWVPENCEGLGEKVFVCGVNGDDPEFAERKAEDMRRLDDLLEEMLEIVDDYKLPHMFLLADKKVEDRWKFDVWNNIEHDRLSEIFEFVLNHYSKEEGHGNS